MSGWLARFRTIDPAWKFSIGVYLVARIALTIWSLCILLLFPSVAQNLDLFGAPVLAAFDLQTSERYAYSRLVDGVTLAFRADDPGFVSDVQTASKWSLKDGRAVAGKYAGQSLGASPFSIEEIFPYHDTHIEKNPILAVWQRFDANSYLAIAERGYANDFTVTLFPVYPLMIRTGMALVGNEMLAALLVSNLAMIGAMFFLYRLFEKTIGDQAVRRAIAYWLVFPTGFFLLAPYTEAPFLFFTLGAFVFAQRNRWGLAAVFGALAALTRLQGVALVLPLAYLVWRQADSFKTMVRRGAVLVLIPIATGAFLLFTNLSILSGYEGIMHARFLMPWENFFASITLLASGQGSFIDLVNVVISLMFGGLLVAIWKKQPMEYTLYSLTMYFVPLFRMTTTQPLVSMDRYVLAIFPAFVLFGIWGKNPWVNRAIVYVSFPLHLYFCAQFFLWGWVG